MTTLRRIRLVRLQLWWMLAVALVLTVFGSMSVPLFLSAALVGLLVLVEIATPRHARPAWIVRLRWFVFAGFVVFAFYVAFRMALMVPEGAV